MKEISGQKNYSKSEKNNVTAKDKRHFLLLIEQVFVGSVISFVFSFILFVGEYDTR